MSKELVINDKLTNKICTELMNGIPLARLARSKDYPSLTRIYKQIMKDKGFANKITEARKYGVQTLIDKLLQVFKYQEIEDPNAILWIREKTKFITFLANKLTDLYSDNKVQNVKTDQSIKISWEDNQEDLIDVTAEDVSTATPDKD